MKLEISKTAITHSLELASYSGLHGFWQVEFSNGRLGASHQSKDSVMFGLVLLSATTGTADLVTLMIQANQHPPLATSPRPAGPSASSAISSAGQKPCTSLTIWQHSRSKVSVEKCAKKWTCQFVFANITHQTGKSWSRIQVWKWYTSRKGISTDFPLIQWHGGPV